MPHVTAGPIMPALITASSSASAVAMANASARHLVQGSRLAHHNATGPTQLPMLVLAQQRAFRIETAKGASQWHTTC